MKILFAAVVLFLATAFASAQNDPNRPSFAAIAMDGTKIDTAELRGKVVVLNLWYINCPNCVDEIKLLNALVDEYEDNKDVVFLGLAANPKTNLEKFLVKNPFKYQILPDSQMIIVSKFGTPGNNGELGLPFPMHYVLDREGRIAAKAQGIKGIDAVKSELKRQFASKSATGK